MPNTAHIEVRTEVWVELRHGWWLSDDLLQELRAVFHAIEGFVVERLFLPPYAFDTIQTSPHFMPGTPGHGVLWGVPVECIFPRIEDRFTNHVGAVGTQSRTANVPDQSLPPPIPTVWDRL